MAQPTQVKPGAQPEGTRDEAGAAAAVRSMFDQIAPRYDLLNHVLSCNIDRLWWYKAARTFRSVLGRPEAQVLDLCCGTGDMTLALLRRRPKQARPILAADFAHQMLVRGAVKFVPKGGIALEADALHLPLPSASLDLLTTAFGFRNLANYRAGLEEFYRVLKPAENWASLISASRVESWANYMRSTFAGFCLLWVRSYPGCPDPTAISPVRCTNFLRHRN